MSCSALCRKAVAVLAVSASVISFSSLMPSGSAFAQDGLAKLQSDLVGSWVATVSSSPGRDRLMVVTNVAKTSNDAFALDARFGWANAEQQQVSAAEIIETSQERQLKMTAKSGARIEATQGQNGAFDGTFFGNDGSSSPVMLKKVSDAESQTLQRLGSLSAPPSTMLLGDLRAQNGVQLSAADLKQLMPGAKVVHRTEAGSTRDWTNDPEGTFIASSDNGASTVHRRPSQAKGTWHVGDNGTYCVTLEWRTASENWCRYIFRVGEKFYGVSTIANRAAKAQEFEFNR